MKALCKDSVRNRTGLRSIEVIKFWQVIFCENVSKPDNGILQMKLGDGHV